MARGYGKNLNKQDQFKKNISDVVGKGELNRYNDALKGFINKIKDYEHENAYLEEKRSCISSEFPLFKESENDVFNRGWRKGYSGGYTRGASNGFFKGSIESQYIGHQKGIEEGMQEGWNFGFDEGFKTGIRKVFRDARDAGIDLSSLELMEYISREDKIKGLMKNLYKQLTKGNFDV
jgi:flagellar biosynthesis/type III secretory pathway protein FliH